MNEVTEKTMELSGEDYFKWGTSAKVLEQEHVWGSGRAGTTWER